MFLSVGPVSQQPIQVRHVGVRVQPQLCGSLRVALIAGQGSLGPNSGRAPTRSGKKAMLRAARSRCTHTAYGTESRPSNCFIFKHYNIPGVRLCP